MNVTRPLRILLVDDDEVDRMAMVRGFSKAKVPAEFEVAKDGQEALEILRGEGRSAPLAGPCLILLDLNMPRMDGLALLGEIRADPSLRSHVVFVVTTSDDERDRAAAYDQMVAGYVVKRNAGPGYQDLVQLLDTYWRVVAPPSL